MFSGKSWAVLLCTMALAQDATFRTGVKEVLVPVVVRDSAGRPVGGLKAEDFQLFDRGRRQTISSFSALADIGSVSPNGSTEAAGTAADSTEPREPGAVSAKPAARERSVAYVFDDVNTGFVEFARTRAAALRYFQAGLPSEERAAICSFSGRTSQPFTTDRQKLEDAVSKLRVSLTPGHGDANPCPYVSYYLADLIVRHDDKRALEAATQQTADCMHAPADAQQLALETAQREILIGDQDIRMWAAGLRRVIRLLQERPAPRVLVLASSGLYSQTPLGIKAIADTLDLAARAGVTISTLHARGVYTMAQADAMRQTYPSSLEQGYYRDSAYAEENTLADLANGTGGTYFRHNNDLAAGFAQLSAPPQYSYLLGFSPSPLKPDGGFHALKVRLPSRGGVSVEARPGYYAPKSPKGRAEDLVAEEIDDAVQSRDEPTGIPLDAAVQTVRAGKADARLSVLAKVHVRPLQFQKVEGRNHDVLTVVAVVFDQDGGYVVGNRNTINLMLRDETLAGKEDPAVNVQSNFEVRPGSYLVRVVVCDRGGGDLSSRNVRVVVR
jgi:VWFA-related protein